MIHSHNIRGKRFSQNSVSQNMERVHAGQSSIAKLLVVLLILVLSVTTGFLSGTLGELISMGIAVPYRNSVLLFSCIGIAVISFSLLTLQYKFLKSIQITIGVTAVFAFLLMILLNQLNINYILDLILLVPMGVFFGFLTLVSAYLSAGLREVSFYRQTLPFSILCNCIIVLTAILTSRFIYLYGEINSGPFLDSRDAGVLPTYTFPIAVLSGFIFGLGTTILTYKEAEHRNKHTSAFLSLFNWAILISSWGGTSFYNLDLSRVNFQDSVLENTDLRAINLYRVCFQGVSGLERARVDNRYLDLNLPKVKKLLTRGIIEERNFSNLCLQGAYLKGMDLRHINFRNTSLNGADLRETDLRGSIFFRAQVMDVDFTGANLTGICIKDWSVDSQTRFDNVVCDYIYRNLDDQGELFDRYPATRNFEPKEFESLYQEVENVVELVFKEGVNWRAFAFTLQKLQIEDEGLGLQLKGIEKRGDLWVVKVTHSENLPKLEVEHRISTSYEELKLQLAAKEIQINKLLGIASDQAEALKEWSRKPFGNNFFITGSTITNLAGQGEIKYEEAANQVRSIVASATNPSQITASAQTLMSQLQRQEVADTFNTQAELIQQVLLTEAQKDRVFQQFLLQQGQQIIGVIPESAIASAIQGAIAKLNTQFP